MRGGSRFTTDSTAARLFCVAMVLACFAPLVKC